MARHPEPPKDGDYFVGLNTFCETASPSPGQIRDALRAAEPGDQRPWAAKSNPNSPSG